MACCANCFGDRGLSEIMHTTSFGRGQCHYCGRADVQVTQPRDLNDLFSAVLNIYDENPAGSGIVAQLRQDWALFRTPEMDDLKAVRLVRDIMDDPELPRRLYVPSARFSSDRLLRWGELRDELMYRNRYFPDTVIDAARLGQLLKMLKAQEMPAVWFRARIQPGDDAFAIDQMGAPPSYIAAHGRANPAGIPYLYLASTPITAVGEVRPHAGEVVSVAQFYVNTTSMSLVDLRAPKERVSPFDLGDEDEIGALRSDLAFLERLGEELTRPIRPAGAAIEYVPSQYLCEFIKKGGWDGVVYRSSVSDGINLALFDPARAVPKHVGRWRVARVSPEIQELGGAPAGSGQKLSERVRCWIKNKLRSWTTSTSTSSTQS